MKIKISLKKEFFLTAMNCLINWYKKYVPITPNSWLSTPTTKFIEPPNLTYF
ncbi:hypothetical protein G15_3131 [Enterococcus avium]|nr:hypothetical protein G15_3131 [Enterococcus avium]